MTFCNSTGFYSDYWPDCWWI